MEIVLIPIVNINKFKEAYTKTSSCSRFIVSPVKINRANLKGSMMLKMIIFYILLWQKEWQ